MIACPCGSGRFEISCCGPYHGGKPAPTAEALMRSRYSAFVRGNLDYIERTCAGDAARAFDRQDLAASLPVTEWLGLSIEATERGGIEDNDGTVRFTVRFRQGGRLFEQTETSLFAKIDGEWRYMCGEFSAQAAAGKTPGRNDPCPCGSGRKFKKCHGA
jgi:SEC-C motif-containing protein